MSARVAMPPPSAQRQRRRALLISCGLALGPAVALGLARFAYGLLLPSMRANLGWSFAQAGALNSANSVGYLAGALLTAVISRRIGVRRAFAAGFVATALALLLSAATGSFALLLVLRALAGYTGALVFVAGASLVAATASSVPGDAPLLLTIYASGAGVGIAVSGAALPAVLSHGGSGAWRIGWLLLGCGAIAALIAAWPALRHAGEPPAAPPSSPGGWSLRQLKPLTVAYVLYGAGYIIYATFIVTLLRERGAGAGMITGFWVTLGLAAAASTFFWGGALRRLRGGYGPSAVMAVVCAGALLPLLSSSPVAAYASAALFGGSFLAVVSAAFALVRRSLPAYAWTGAIATLTAFFACGQSAGPLLSGVLSDGPGGVRAGLQLAVVVLLAAAAVACLQRERPNTDDGTR